MQDKQKQIEEMAQAMGDFVLEDSAKCDIELSKHLIAKGYRKQSDTAREILQYLYEKMGNVSLSDTELVLSLAAKYGVEVEE